MQTDNPTPGHEPTDANVTGLFIFGGALLVCLVLTLAGIAAAFKGFAYYRSRRQTAPTSLVRADPDYTGPLLQVHPEADLRRMQAGNRDSLDTYAWIDQPSGTVRLPIDRAMDLIAERGLPPVSPGKTLEALQRERAQPLPRP